MSDSTPISSAMDWDDYRLFAALARSGSVRRSAGELGISHSTLSRRLSSFEARIGAQLFERGTHGFSLTEAGGLLLQRVDEARAAFDAGHRALDGIDRRMVGPIRVTMPDFLAYHLLLPAIDAFVRAHLSVEIELDVSYDASDLTRREADVAVRMMMVGESPPDVLVGRKVGVSHATGYATPGYIERNAPNDPEGTARWLRWSADDDGSWIADTAHPHCALIGSYNSAELQRHAAAEGLGMAVIPCLIGDMDPRLVRTSTTTPTPARELWVLTHVDLRHTARMKAFRDAIVRAIVAADDRLTGALSQGGRYRNSTRKRELAFFEIGLDNLGTPRLGALSFLKIAAHCGRSRRFDQLPKSSHSGGAFSEAPYWRQCGQRALISKVRKRPIRVSCMQSAKGCSSATVNMCT